MKIPKDDQENWKNLLRSQKQAREAGELTVMFVVLTRDSCPKYILEAAEKAAKNLGMEVDVRSKRQLQTLSQKEKHELITETKNVLDTNSENMLSSTYTDD